ncbi:MAG: phosphatidate cytidylyltransferase [Gammaproteobacteria bacterium]
MLKARILTALAVAPPVLAVMFLAPPFLFEALVGAVIIGAAWEWSGLMGCASRIGRVLYTLVVAMLVIAAGVWMADDSRAFTYLIVVSLAWWAFAFAWLAIGPARQPGTAIAGLCGVLTLVPAFAALTALHAWDEFGPWRLLYLLALVWLADIGAYFFGRAFGRTKLAPRVSPGKTWEGVAGAFVVAALVITAGFYFSLDFGGPVAFAVFSLATVALSIVGDLAESMFKRHQGVKDSGTLLPGHGGLLDRIDSLTSAGPLFVGGMLWLA